MDRKLQSSIDRLASRLSRLEVRGRGRGRGRGRQTRRRSRSRSRSRTRVNPPVNLPGPSITQRNTSRNTTFALGTMRLRSTGSLYVPDDIKGPVGRAFSPYPTYKGDGWAPPELNALAKIYSQVSIKALKIRWEPMVGTTANGAITIAATGDNHTGTAITEAGVLSTSPNVTGPVWAEKTLVVPQHLLNQRKSFPVYKDVTTLNAADGVGVVIMIWYNVPKTTDAQPYGRMWAEYEVEFSGFGVQ